LACNYTSSLLNIHHCAIYDNTAQANGGGIWSSHYHSVYQHGTVNQCTIEGNTASAGSGIYCNPYSGLEIVNTIVANNSGNGAYYRNSNTTDNFTYGDFHNNNGGNFAGSGIPSSMGVLITVNANGDSCDVFRNILLDPLFVNAPQNDFHLTSGSPCIDAGNPAASYFDPDGTVADMGAFYYDQSVLHLTLTPLNPPILIPPSGGRFQFTALVENDSAAAVQFDFWTMVTLPGGGTIGPLINIGDRILSPNSSLSRNFTQEINAPVGSGVFLYRGYVGQYPSTVWGQDQFEVVKLASGDGQPADYTGNGWGQYFEESGEESPGSSTPVPEEYVLGRPFPNPFNPTATIIYHLQTANHVHLRVYDTAGRLAVTLVDGWREAGSHELIFNASGLPSGIYLARLTAGDFQQMQKLVLLK
jgi:hypothetical protein